LKIKEYYKENNYIHYSNCHEDANIVIKYVNKENSNILSIASALDNSLALLLTNPRFVTAIDTNITQIYLCNLKKMGIKYLSYDEFLILIGIVDGDSLHYYYKISLYLDIDTKKYFDNHLYLISDAKIVNCGRFEYYFQVFKNKVLPLVHRKITVHNFMNQDSLDQQIAYYQNKFDNKRFRMMFKIFFSEFVMAKVGRDKTFFKYNKDPLSINLKRRFDRGVNNNLNKKNPYLQYVLYNKFVDMPVYLDKNNYEIIRSRIDRLQIINQSLDEVLNSSVKYDYMNLSDVFEYCDESLMDNYEQNISNLLNAGGRVLFWNMNNDRFFNRLTNLEISNVNDLAFYYKRVLLYQKEGSDD